MNFIYLFLRRQIRSEFKRLRAKNKGLFTASLKNAIKIKQLEGRVEYLQRLNACYAADRQQMMAEHGPDYAARKFPRVTTFLNQKEKEGKGE